MTSLNSSPYSERRGEAPQDAPPVPKLPEDLGPRGLAVAEHYDTSSNSQRPERSSTVSTYSSQMSAIIPGKYDHEKSRRAASLRHPGERPVVVDGTEALGTKKAVNYVKRKQLPSTSNGASYLDRDSVAPDQDHSSVAPAESGAEEAVFEDAVEDVRSPLLETDTVPGFFTPAAVDSPSPVLERIVNRREAIDERRRSSSGHRASTAAAESPPKPPDVDHPALRKKSELRAAVQPADYQVDLTNTVDTEVHTYYADPVYHETIKPEVHHVTHNVVDKDIHHHHIQHRVLPIREVEHLPPKHFVPHGPGGSLIEVDESELPGRTGDQSVWSVQQTGPTGAGDTLERSPRSRETHARSYTNERGVPTTEQVWRHPPRMSDGMSGDTSVDAGQRVTHSGATTGAKAPHEQDAETAVHSQRQARDPSYGKPPMPGSKAASEQAYMQKPAATREREAEATVAAARAAAMHR